MATTPTVPTPGPAPAAPARTYLGVDGNVHDQNGNTYAPGTTPNTGTGNLSNPGTVVSNNGGGVAVAQPSAAKPAGAVFSAKSATDFTNNTILPALQNGMNNMITQNDKNSQSDLTRFLPGETADQYNTRVSSVNAAKGTPTPLPATTPQDTAANQIANTPEPGNQFIYDNNGSRVEVPLGTPLPSGYTTATPANPTLRGHTVVNQFNSENGMTYQQYSDGTYGVAGLDGSFAGTVSADEFNQAQSTSPTEVLKGIASGLASLKNGPLPLTAPQQAQIDALNSSLASAVTAQQQANANFTGATTIATNLAGMGNSISGIGLIKSTVDSGIAKILDLQTKAAGAIAQMQESFDKDNMTQMYTYYQAMTAATKAIDDNITAMHTFAFQQKEHADQEADNLRTFNNTVQQEAITNKREDALASSTLATQALERTKTQMDIDSINQMNAASSAIGGSTLGADGQPDPVKQQAYLQTIAKQNPGLALQIKAAADYRLPLTARFFQTAAGQKFTQEMLQYDPTWDATNYAAKQATVTSFTSGPYSKTVNALNTATAHLATLDTQYAKLNNGLGNGGFEPLNVLQNSILGSTGISPTSGVKLNVAAVTGELAAAFKASGATDTEIKSLGTIDQNSSPAAVKSYVSAASSLLAGKLGALNETYVAGVGKAPATPLLRTDAQTSLSNLKNQGYQIDVPGVIYTDPVAYQKFVPDAASKMDAAKVMLQNNGLPVTPENILQAAQIDQLQ